MSDIAINRLTASVQKAPNAERIHLDHGDILIREGDEADSVYVLLEGSLSISRVLDHGSTVFAVIDQPGSLVGEMVPLGGGSRTATVTAQASAKLISMPVEAFDDLLASDPSLADDLVEAALRRAEEGELAEILANHFGIMDEATLVGACGNVTWRKLAQGETLFEEDDTSDSVYFVVKGRLQATRRDPIRGETKTGQNGRGDVVGEVGLLGQGPRGASVTALRDTVVAEMTESTFLGLIEGQPRMLIELYLKALARTESPRWHSAPSTVVGLVGSQFVDTASLARGIVNELRSHGDINWLSPSRVDSELGTPGIFNAAPGAIEDVRVSRFLYEAELDSDFLVIEIGQEPGPWSRRALGMIDHVMLAVSPDPDQTERAEIEAIIGASPPGVQRTAVVVHTTNDDPTGSMELRTRLAADDVIHVRDSSVSDLGRLARLSVGRANTLVLSGGGGRGFAHLGTFRALVELGFPIDAVGGTSMGAVLGSAIAKGMPYDEIVGWAQRTFPDALDYTIPMVSLTKGARIARHARETFGDLDIEDLWLNYFAVSTDLTTSRPRIHDSGSIAMAVRATSAIPGVMPPVPDGGALLIDGAVLNNLPIDVARVRSPRGLVVASDVAPSRGPGAHGDYGLSVSGWQALRSKFGRDRSPYPRMSAVLMRSMITASMRERDTQVRTGLADCYLDLNIRGVSMLDFGSPGEVAQMGYDAAMPILEEWMTSLESEGDRIPTEVRL